MKKQFNIQIEENAKIEIANAYEWYETQKEGLEEIFFFEIQKAINAIQKHLMDTNKSIITDNFH